MGADALTKPLFILKFTLFRDVLGPVDAQTCTLRRRVRYLLVVRRYVAPFTKLKNVQHAIKPVRLGALGGHFACNKPDLEFFRLLFLTPTRSFGVSYSATWLGVKLHLGRLRQMAHVPTCFTSALFIALRTYAWIKIISVMIVSVIRVDKITSRKKYSPKYSRRSRRIYFKVTTEWMLCTSVDVSLHRGLAKVETTSWIRRPSVHSTETVTHFVNNVGIKNRHNKTHGRNRARAGAIFNRGGGN